METQLFIGSRQVVETNEQNGKIQYTLNDASQDTVLKEQYEKMVKEIPYDDGMVRVYKWSPAVKEILDVLLKYDAKMIENGFILDRVEESAAQNYKAAIAKLLNVDFEHNVKMSDIDKVFRS